MDSLHAAYDAARQALHAGEFKRAIALLDHILQQFPQFVDASQLRGEAYLQAHRYDDAVATFQQVLQADPEHMNALYGLGAACHAVGNEADARAAWEQALEIQPDLAEQRPLIHEVFPALGAQPAEQQTHAGRARLYTRNGSFSRAVRVLRVQVRAQPQRTDLAVALAETLWRAKRLADTRRVCYNVLAVNPQLVKPTLLLAYMLLEDDQPGGSALWQRGAAQDPLQNVARALFTPLPNIPSPALQFIPLQGEAVAEQPQSDPASDDDALLLRLLTGTFPSTSDRAQLPEPTPSRLSEDEATMDNDVNEHAMENVLPAGPSPNTIDLTPATTNASSEHVPADAFAAMLAQADVAPAHQVLCLAVARLGWSLDQQRALSIYKQLVKDGTLLDDVVTDLLEYIGSTDDAPLQHTIYRVLGDAYMRQHHVAEATDAYGRAFPEYTVPQPTH